MFAAQRHFPLVGLMPPDSTGVGIRRERERAEHFQRNKKEGAVGKFRTQLRPQTMRSSAVNPPPFLKHRCAVPFWYSHVVLSVTQLSQVFEVRKGADKLQTVI